MNWIEREYPNTIYILEVKYSGGGDIAITQARCKEEPEEKDNKYGFTSNHRTYESAKKEAVSVSKQLGIAFPC